MSIFLHSKGSSCQCPSPLKLMCDSLFLVTGLPVVDQKLIFKKSKREEALIRPNVKFEF